MRKRGFLALFAAALLGGTKAARAARKRQRILVIGAGIAGLAAARALKNAGHEVIVLEARERISGRIHTSRKWPDAPLDLGASWIHGVDGNPLSRLAQTIAAPRILTDAERSVIYNAAGQRLTAQDEERLDELRALIAARLQIARRTGADISLATALAPLLQSLGRTPADARLLHFLLASEIEHETSGSLAQLSARWFDDDEKFGGADALFAQGFGAVTQFLAQGLRIEPGQSVGAIHWHRSPIEVSTQKTTWRGDCAIITLPLGVLKAQRVRFHPDLPEEKSSAIAALGMGVLNKCYLRYPAAFWPERADWLGYASAQPGEWAEWLSLARACGKPILLGFHAADAGRALEAQSDAQIIASAQRTLQTIFGTRIPAPLDFQITRWAADPFALGSYSFNAVGSDPDMRTALAAPLAGRLFFAGEATHRNYFGTTHGALLSGQSAAEAVLAE